MIEPTKAQKRGIFTVVFLVLLLAYALGIAAVAYHNYRQDRLEAGIEDNALKIKRVTPPVPKPVVIDAAPVILKAKEAAAKEVDKKVEKVREELETKVGVAIEKASRVNKRFEEHMTGGKPQ